MTIRIHYELNGGYWDPKEEIKEAFFTDFYHFITTHYDSPLKTINVRDFIHAKPYVMGSLASPFYLKEEIGGKLEDQPEEYFIGYCYHRGKYIDLIQHLIRFFADWRRIEGCAEPHAEDFFASSWAALVDTAKFFAYTTLEDLQNSPESPSVRCETILSYLQHCPGAYEPPYVVDGTINQRLAKPYRKGYYFYGWYDNPDFKGEPVHFVDRHATADLTYYARWKTYTYLHSNDGYRTFEELYDDFLRDFSSFLNTSVNKTIECDPIHGRISYFLKKSENGKLNAFFQKKTYYDKWFWLIDYLRSLKKTEEERAYFDFNDGRFGSEEQVRWELNSLFVGGFHLTWPKTGDYSGPGIKEALADRTNSQILTVDYFINERVTLPRITRPGFKFLGWYENSEGDGEAITVITDDRYANRTLYAKWKRMNS